MGMKEVGVWLLLGLHLHYCLVGGVGMDREIQKSLMKASTAAPARLISNSTISVERQESSQCKIVRPTFCTEVDWSVPEDQAEKVLRAKGDLQVEMMVINFQGTRECQREYKSLHCRYLYPKCGEDGQPKFPCKHECESFTKLQDKSFYMNSEMQGYSASPV
eukprot:jgi/Bigna1/88352/estExt_fgenesh1_pg.C_310037